VVWEANLKNWFDRLPSWLGTIVGILAFRALAAWVLAPLLDFVPAYGLFGGIFIIGIILLHRAGTGKRRMLQLVIFALLSGSATLLLYGASLETRKDSSYGWWYVAGAICFGILFLTAWLLTRNSDGGQDRNDQPKDYEETKFQPEL